MSSYHCSVKVGAKGKAGPHASYISREGKYEKTRSNEKLEHVEHANMPNWAEQNPAQFWQAADQHERANGATYREIEIALPREMTPEQRVELVHDMVEQELGDKHAYTWAIHNPEAALEGGEQPHAHIMYSERTIDGIDRDPEQYFKRYNAKNPEKGGCRKDSAGTEERLLATRERWAKVQNLHLERHGLDARVDHRSLKEQGIDRTPEPHFGPGRIQRMTGMQDAELAAVLERRAAEGEKERATDELGKSIIDVAGDLKAAIADRDQKIKQGQENEQRINGSLERIRSYVETASGARDHADGALLSSKHSLIAVTGHTRNIERSAQGAIQGAERRVIERDYGRVVEASKRQFERTGNLVQQVVGNIDRVIQPITAAPKYIEIYTLERERKAAERAQAARQVAATTNLLPKPQKALVRPFVASAADVFASVVPPFDQSNTSEPKARVVEAPARLHADDTALFQHIEQAIAVAQVSESSKDIEALASGFRKIDQVQSELTKAATPNGWDTRPFDEHSASQQLATRDRDRRHAAINAEAKAAGHTQLPFAVGQSTLITSTFDHSQEAAAEALTRHVRSERPLGLFSRETKDTKAWDAQKAALETNKAGWDKAVAWRDNKEAVAVTADRATFHTRLDEVRKEYAIKSDAAVAKCAPARTRLQDFAQERKRLESRVEKTLSPAKQQELLRERGRNRGQSMER